MGVILDTSVLLAAERATLRMPEFLASLGDEPVAIATITASELLHGCHGLGDAGTRARRAAYVEGVLGMIPVLPFGVAEARRHAELWLTLVQRGEQIHAHDMLVGATALAQGYALATLRQREFERIPGLVVVGVERFGG